VRDSTDKTGADDLPGVFLDAKPAEIFYLFPEIVTGINYSQIFLTLGRKKTKTQISGSINCKPLVGL
jgi:hypothetical protein